LAQVTSQSMTHKLYLDALAPRALRRVKVFENLPPKDIVSYYHKKLDKAHSNPRTLIKIYREYMKTVDHPQYAFLVRCFHHLANTFGFNSFWSTRDKQLIHTIPSFKWLLFDLIERRHKLRAKFAPRLLYSMAAVEYRCWQLMPAILDLVEQHMSSWTLPALSTMALSLSLLGIGDTKGPNTFGPVSDLSRDYSGLVDRLVIEAARRFVWPQLREGASPDSREPSDYVLPDGGEGTAFDWAALAFAVVINGTYDSPTAEMTPLPYFLKYAVEQAGDDLDESGWVQFFLYQTLYCCDVEKPKSEIAIKRVSQTHRRRLCMLVCIHIVVRPCR